VLGVEITVGDPASAELRTVLRRHLDFARSHTAPEAVFALDADDLADPSVAVYCARRRERVLAIGALRELDASHGELKSMHTVEEARRQGVGRAMVDHLLGEAFRRGYARVSLETGAGDAFAPARALYAGAGFEECGPFGDYPDAATSVFMTREVGEP
jgi:putative acetyltransferase